MKFGFIGQAYTGRAKSMDAERCINLYLEHTESDSGKKEPAALLGTPGLSGYGTLAAGLPGVRGLWQEPATGRVFAVSSNVLYEIVSGGAVTNRGTLNEAAGLSSYVSMRSNGTQLVISSNGAGYILTLATNVLTQITLANYPFVNSNQPGAQGFLGANQFELLDTYLIALVPNSRKWTISFVNDATDWSALSFASKDSWPDNLVGLIMNQRLLWLFGTQRSEVWYDAGQASFPFVRVQGAQLETGLAAQVSLHRVDNAIAWLGADERGQGIAYKSEQYQPKRISNHAVEYQWSQYGSISDCEAWAEQHGGHTWSVFYFPTGDATWVYDHSTEGWHQRAWWDPVNGGYHAHLARNHVFAFGKHLVGDRQSGTIYQQSLNLYDDAGNPKRWLRSCPVFQERKRLYFRSLDLYLTSGQGLSAGQGSAPLVNLRCSDDGGFTWGNELPESMGVLGDYTYRTQWRRLGSARDRVFEVSGSDPIPVQITEAYLETSGASGA